MNYTSKITSVNKTDSFNTFDGKVMNKYVVTFENGHNPHIYKIGDFGHQVGDEVCYDLDQAKNKAKLEKPQFKAAPTSAPKNSYSNPKDDVQKYIIRQSSLNRATDILGGRDFVDVEEIISLARTFENYVHNG